MPFVASESIQAIAECLRHARRVLFITGAGMSADSGLPTYRGIGGLYNDRLTEDEMPIETALSAEVMATQPELTWKYLYQIESACRGADFNQGHAMIAQWEKEKSDVWVLTQNIDGFHRRAGSQKVIEIHGNLLNLHCMQCNYSEELSDFSGLQVLPPICPQCGGVLRPSVILFGEALEPKNVTLLYRELAQGFDLLFSIGTSSLFPYIVQPVLHTHQNGGVCVEINPEPTQISEMVDYKLNGKAAEVLQQIDAAYQKLLLKH